MITSRNLGILVSGIYVLASAYLIYTQGLFGESFIAILLGFPWSFILAFIEFGNVSGAFLYLLVLAPLFLNAVLLYGIGVWIAKKRAR